MRFLRQIIALPLLFWCSACGVQPDHFGAHEVSYDSLSGWAADDHAEALAVFKQSCPILARDARAQSSGSGLQITEPVWQSLCNEARTVPAGDAEQARQFFERRFVPWRVTNNGQENGLFTGYYEPTLYGSKHKHGDFIYPLYAAPAGLKHKKPYYTHAQINRGALGKKHLEIVYVDDPVMRFFLQIQGSGIIRFPDGSERLIGYSDQNGHGYVSLGKVMGDEGYIPKDQINFFTLRQYLYDHPHEAFGLMERNPSYVFFKWLNERGPVGATGAVLTPRRSLAVDSKYIPYGLPLFLETDLPGTPGAPATSFHRIMIAQDTGGAIRGPIRGDIFFGPGEDAEYFAGYMKGRGSYSILLPREVAYQLH